MLSEDGSTETKGEEENQPLCQMEVRETASATKRSHEFKEDAKCTRRMYKMPKVCCEASLWQGPACATTVFRW